MTSTPDEPPKNISKTVINYFPILRREEKSLPATLARLTALDGISFNVICRSCNLREGLISTGFNNLRKAVNTMRKMVVDYCNQIRNSQITKIADNKTMKDFSYQ